MFLFAFNSLVGALFIIIFLPETKGKSFDEIVDLFWEKGEWCQRCQSVLREWNELHVSFKLINVFYKLHLAVMEVFCFYSVFVSKRVKYQSLLQEAEN